MIAVSSKANGIENRKRPVSSVIIEWVPICNIPSNNINPAPNEKPNPSIILGLSNRIGIIQEQPNSIINKIVGINRESEGEGVFISKITTNGSPAKDFINQFSLILLDK